jgi:pimeloyl-ACP methyl ester carboxylesterase
VAGIAADLRERGHDVLVFDLRGHGASDPARLSMGRAERADIRAALAWAKGRGYEPERIAWLGQSMGAATIFYEALENPEITRLIMDSPYGDLPALLNEQLTLHSGLPRPFNPGILLAARLLFGTRTDDLVPIRLASRWDGRPLLVLHGGADFIVPVGQGRAIALAAGEGTRLVVWERAGHIQIHRDDPEGYMGVVEGFVSGPAQPEEKATEARERSGRGYNQTSK